MALFKSLSRSQKEAVGLLQIGTFLEYFDLMLYVHMAVLLNELFFPKYDPHTAALMSAFAFCSTYVLRPFGALIFGYIGDTFGRKSTVVITTMMMAVSCIIMANLPTYAQIGITATWIVTVCRLTQGLSSMGEIIGAQVYLAEIIEPPARHTAGAFLHVASSMGATAALGVAALVTHNGLNWRIAFGIGAAIAVTGSIARVRLRETPEFIVARQHKKNTKKIKEDVSPIMFAKNFIGSLFLYSGWPVSFYLVFFYFQGMLSDKFGYVPEDIILHNFFLGIVFFSSFILYAVLTLFLKPFDIVKPRIYTGLILIALLPFVVSCCESPKSLFFFQSLLLVFSFACSPCEPILIKHFSTLNRLTTTSFVYALSRCAVYIITSFGLIFFCEWFGHYGVWVLAFPIRATA